MRADRKHGLYATESAVTIEGGWHGGGLMRKNNLWEEDAQMNPIQLSDEFCLPSTSKGRRHFPSTYNSVAHSHSAVNLSRLRPFTQVSKDEFSSGYESDVESSSPKHSTRRRVVSTPTRMPVQPITVPVKDDDYDEPKIYGHELFDDRGSVKSYKLGGSRPPSRSDIPAAPSTIKVKGKGKERRKRRGSVASVGTNASANGGGYLFWKGVHDNSESQPAIPPSRSDSKQAASIRFTGFNENLKTPEEVWYFLRCLIGIEIQEECGNLWKLQDLDVHPEDFDNTPEDGSDGYYEFDGARDTPIMRYLIRNFLLTFPLIRDTPSPYTADRGDFQKMENPDADIMDNETMPVYWTRGLLPLLQALHERNLSDPSDRSERSLWSILWGIYLRKTLQKFICGGLKVCSQVPSEEVNGTPHHRDSLYNPLMNFEWNNHPKRQIPVEEPSPVSSRDDKKRFSFFRRPTILAKHVLHERRITQTSQSASVLDVFDFHPDASPTSPIGNGLRESVFGVLPAIETEDEAIMDSSDHPAASNTNGKEPSKFKAVNGHSVPRSSVEDDAVTAEDDPQSPTLFYSLAPTSPTPYTPVTPDAISENGYGPRIHHPKETQDLRKELREAVESAKNNEKEKSPKVDHEFKLDLNLPSVDVGSEVQGYSLDPPSPTSPNTQVDVKSDGGLAPRNLVHAAMNLPKEFGSHYKPPGSIPLNKSNGEVYIDLVPKYGHSWPWGAPVPFWKGTPVHRVAWGGFEVDVVGVRKGLFDHSFILRVRRPSRRDEYVLRNESQFKKYLSELDKQYPSSHVRRLPQAKDKEDDSATVFPEKKSRNTKPNGNLSQRLQQVLEEDATPVVNFQTQKSKTGYRKSFIDQVVVPLGGTSIASRRNTMSGRSMITFSDRGSLAPSMNTPIRTIDVDLSKPPPYETQRRALRAWLRDTLSIRTVGHQKETAAFLLLGAIRPKDKDIRDIQKREVIDQERRTVRLNAAQSTADRVKSLHDTVVEFQNECVHGEGLANISDAIKITARFNDLPSNILQAAEWSRAGLAQSIYDILVAGDHSTSIFSALKTLHLQFPWFLLRQALKLPKSSMMASAMQDILLTKKFGKHSLLQSVLAATLDDEPIKLYNELDDVRSRIQSPTMCEKLYRFVHAPRDVKELIRRHAQSNNLELVVAIVRGADSPRLDKYDLERVVKAAKTYRSFLKKNNPTPLGKHLVDNPHVRLILDLQLYLKLLSKQRDASQIRSMLADEQLADALEVLVSPLMEFLKRTYKVGNASTAVLDLQKFLDQLIIIVEALRNRIQDPQKSVKVISRLLARHTQSLYSYIHQVHQNDTIIEEFFQWFWTCSVFLRRGLAQTLDLDALVPSNEEDKDFLLGEIDDLVEYQKDRKRRAYELMCRRYASDVDGDDPVVVDGDGQGKSRMEPLLEPQPTGPKLTEIPRCLRNFRNQLVKIFAV